MRDRTRWRQELVKELRQHWPPTGQPLSPAQLCEIELGLTVLRDLVPDAPASALWALVTGFPPPRPKGASWTSDQLRHCTVLRTLLAHTRTRYDWTEALAAYREVAEHLRAFDVDADLCSYRPHPVSVAASRSVVYERTLQRAVPHRRHGIAVGTPDASYLLTVGEQRTSVRVPPVPDGTLPPPRSHRLRRQANRTALDLDYGQLCATAQRLDARAESAGMHTAYARVLKRIDLHLFDAAQTTLYSMREDGVPLVLDGLTHLVGMVSAGKTTLLDIIAAWAADQGLQVTLVVGDVVSALDRVERFLQLGYRAAPVLGAYSRPRQIEQLHRACAARTSSTSLLGTDTYRHRGFDLLGTACLLDACLHESTRTPFALGREPCATLQPISGAKELTGDDGEEDEDEGDAEEHTGRGWTHDGVARHAPNNDGDDSAAGGAAATGRPVACPFYTICPRHRVDMELIDAPIWVATPASLVYTRVSPVLNSEDIRMAELVYRTRDLVLVDEADAVQVQLDLAFSPTQTLSGGPDGWLDRLRVHINEQVLSRSRSQFAQREAREYEQALTLALTAVKGIYGMLLQQELERVLTPEWVHFDYFSAWGLLTQLARALSGSGDPPEATAQQRYETLRTAFDALLDHPTGDGPLAEVTRVLCAATDERQHYAAIDAWLTAQGNTIACSPDERAVAAVRLRFAIYVAVLQHELQHVMHRWRMVEALFQLDGASLGMLQKPPLDYLPVLPDAPMGNILGFQYQPPEQSAHGGTLRFLRCQGVGRWLLLHLHELFAADGVAGPHVLLLSATSWAGASDTYHVQHPPAGLITMPEEEIAEISQSPFSFDILTYQDDRNRPITVSGQYGEARLRAVRELLTQLVEPIEHDPQSSEFERVRRRLERDRQRILVVVGSYLEARAAYEHVITIRTDWAGDDVTAPQVAYLIPDDAGPDGNEEVPEPSFSFGFEASWTYRRRGGGGLAALPRGQVNRFADTEAWILIAPLKAIERGHNILNRVSAAAIGAAYVLVRPHPHPDDISGVIHSMNAWAIRTTDEARPAPATGADLEACASAFAREAYGRWLHYLARQVTYSNATPEERERLVWDQLVALWQVIGRLVRGGKAAEVHFMDARFAEATAEGREQGDTSMTSLLVGMQQVLAPYFASAPAGTNAGAKETPHPATRDPGLPARHSADITMADRLIVQTLYRPLYSALTRHLTGVTTHAVLP